MHLICDPHVDELCEFHAQYVRCDGLMSRDVVALCEQEDHDEQSLSGQKYHGVMNVGVLHVVPSGVQIHVRGALCYGWSLLLDGVDRDLLHEHQHRDELACKQ